MPQRVSAHDRAIEETWGLLADVGLRAFGSLFLSEEPALDSAGEKSTRRAAC
jgi:hypothetical protein